MTTMHASRSGARDGEVAGDRQQPGGHSAAARVIRARVLPGAHECLLRHILGDPLVADDRDDEAVDPRLEAPYEGRRGVRVARCQTGQQGFVGES